MPERLNQHGFSLIELVVIITILGILAAFAVPRFESLEVEARSAATAALGGDLRSGAALAHAMWLAQGQPESVTVNGQTIAMANGYPTVAAIDGTIASLDGFLLDASGSPGVFAKTDDGTTPVGDCFVSYAASAALGAAPTITVDTSGC
jgi:MSHA pilin protein MshA